MGNLPGVRHPICGSLPEAAFLGSRGTYLCPPSTHYAAINKLPRFPFWSPGLQVRYVASHKSCANQAAMTTSSHWWLPAAVMAGAQHHTCLPNYCCVLSPPTKSEQKAQSSLQTKTIPCHTKKHIVAGVTTPTKCLKHTPAHCDILPLYAISLARVG